MIMVQLVYLQQKPANHVTLIRHYGINSSIYNFNESLTYFSEWVYRFFIIFLTFCFFLQFSAQNWSRRDYGYILSDNHKQKRSPKSSRLETFPETFILLPRARLRPISQLMISLILPARGSSVHILIAKRLLEWRDAVTSKLYKAHNNNETIKNYNVQIICVYVSDWQSGKSSLYFKCGLKWNFFWAGRYISRDTFEKVHF